MNEPVTMELTLQQRELLLEGLRYIRSARRYAFREASAPRDERRDGELQMIGELMGQLQPAPAVPAQTRA